MAADLTAHSFTGAPLRAVLFDLFGTLVPPQDRRLVLARMANDLGADTERLDRVLRESFDERVRGSLGDLRQTLRALSGRAGVRPDGKAVDRAMAHLLEMTRSQLDIAPNILAVLDVFLGAGLRLGLVSDCTIEVPQVWPSVPLSSRFETAVFSSLSGVRKPDPAAYLLATQALAVRPSECGYVGDGGGDELSGAVRLGMFTVRVLTRGEAPTGPYAKDPSFNGPAVTSLDELPIAFGIGRA